MLLKLLEDFVNQKRAAGWPDFVIKNALKEYLQFPVLAFIYSHVDYRNFIFTGGSALRIVYNLPRLSEDLDFNLTMADYKKLDLSLLGQELQQYFRDKFLLSLEFKAQEGLRLYLKFPILKQLGLAANNIAESDFLYVKIEPSLEKFVNPEYEITPISDFGFNFIVRVYSLKFLMTGKIEAILERSWYKGKNNEIDIKGRDYYDLFWYLDKGIEPDYTNLALSLNIRNELELKKILRKKIDDVVTEKKLFYDLANFFREQDFITNFCKNYKTIIKKYLV